MSHGSGAGGPNHPARSPTDVETWSGTGEVASRGAIIIGRFEPPRTASNERLSSDDALGISSGMVDDLRRGEPLDHFIVIEKIGEGAMGEVVAAYDADLDRKVAVKLLKPRDDEQLHDQAVARLFREAKAMARLSHPNVATVHEVGLVGERVFIAMEYVPGVDLRTWLQDPARTDAEILGAFLAAGRGLAAAHAAGVIHRDFKPSNVMVGHDGRVCVVDFGLARALTGAAVTPRPEAPAPATDAALTGTGAAVGTPAYMAPEQQLGQVVDARSDQFSFCVALYEALTRAHPFPGDTPLEISRAIVEGRRAPRSARLRGWLRPALERGMAPARRDRYPDMAALLVDLDVEQRLRRRRWLGAALGASAAVAVAAFAAAELSGPALCRGGERHWRDVWNDQRRAAVTAAFGETGHPAAASHAARAGTALDAYVDAWVRAQRGSCEATHVFGEQSEKLLDVRQRCFDRRHHEARALVQALAGAEQPHAVDRAVEAVYALTPLAVCADAAALSAVVPVPEDPRIRAEVQAITDALDRAVAQERIGKDRESETALRGLIQRAESTGHPPVLAEVLYQTGRLSNKQKRWDDAAELLTEAERAADVGRHDRIRCRAAAELAHAIGFGKGDTRAARAAITRARAVLQRLGGDRELEAELTSQAGLVSIAEQKYDRAVDFQQQALAMRLRLGRPALVAESRARLAAALHWQGKLNEALETYGTAAEEFRATFGESNEWVARSVLGVGNVLLDLERSAEAMESYREALRIRTNAFGERGPLVGDAHMNLAAALDDRQRYSEAELHYNAAIRAYGEGRAKEVARVYRNLGVSLAAQRRFDEARSALARSEELEPEPNPWSQMNVCVTKGEIALGEHQWSLAKEHFVRGAAVARAISPDHDWIPDFWDGEGRAWLGAGQPERALALHQRALGVRERAVGSDSPALIGTLVAIAEAQLSLGQIASSLAHGRRARALLQPNESALVRGRVLLVLARGLRRSKGQRAAARQVAREAEATLAAAGPGASVLLLEARRAAEE